MSRIIQLALLVLFVPTSVTTAAAGPVEAARGVVQRLLPEHAGQFVLEQIPPDGERDVFEIDSVDGKVVVRGNTGVAIASGVNWYLKYRCHCHVSFNGDQLGLPERLPATEGKIRQRSPFQYRYMFNFCAFSYTLAYWDWPQWERMIDWMALHGVNMPLSVTGQEAIWYTVYRKLGMSDKQVRDFLVGPGYLGFGWMGCIDGWGGPLGKDWIDRHAELQKKIVARERELGMTPVLQGFTGHAPAALQELFPSMKLQKLPSWCDFPPTHFVDPGDPMFRRIGKMFIEEQTRQFGTDHLYASDTFIEMPPLDNDPEFLAGMGRAVYEAMRAGDPEAVWVMQGWVFYYSAKFWQPPQTKALLGAVPDDRMVLLDLFCESNPVWKRTEAFCGKPWVFCIIHNFGGVVSLYGGLPQIAANLREAMTAPERGKLSGIGIIMEGFGYNPAVYDYLTEMTWRSEVPEQESWIRDFVRRRYGRSPEPVLAAYETLQDTVYRLSSRTGSIISARPSLAKGGGWKSVGTPYDNARLGRAWQQMAAAADELARLDTYRFDLVNIGRQVLSNHAGDLHIKIGEAYQAKDRVALAASAEEFLQLIRDLDGLLATREEFLLGRWIGDARRWAQNDDQRRLYEWNARNMITLWGPRDSILHEYARKQWSGMLSDFYLPRWELFFKRLDESLAAGEPFDGEAFENEIRDWEVAWTHRTDPFPTEPRGDSVETARRLWAKYGEALARRDAESLTTDKPASCSSALPPYPANLANDGRRNNTDSYWATDANQDPEPWWQVDLEEPTTVGRVVVVLFYGDERHYGIVVETSLDGRTWETAADLRENEEPSTRAGMTCRFEPRPVRFIRVRVPHNSANTGRHLVEVLAFEK